MLLRLCGSLAVERDGQRLDAGLPGRPGRLLFAYLVVNRHRYVPRDEVAEALWREPDPAAVDARLNPLLSKLRRVFGANAIDGRSTLRLCLGDAWVDLEAAVEDIHRAESAVAQQDWPRAWGPALTALFVAERDFRPGEDAPWIEETRRQLTEIRLRALECYAAAALGSRAGARVTCPRPFTSPSTGSTARTGRSAPTRSCARCSRRTSSTAMRSSSPTAPSAAAPRTAWFVLTQLLGRDRVRVYDGSWAEWGRLPGVPVAAA